MSAQENQISLDGPMRRVLASDVPSAEPCPSPDAFAAYYEHSLDPEETERYDAHFASCSSCRAILAGVARASQTATPALHSNEASRRNRNALRFWLVTAAASVVAIFVVIVYVGRSSKSSTENAQLAMSRAVASPTSGQPAPPADAAHAPAPPDDAVAPASKGKSPNFSLPTSDRSPQPVAPPQSPAMDLAAREKSSDAATSVDKKRAAPPTDETKAVNGLSSANADSSTSGAAALSESAAAAAPATSPAPQIAANQNATNNRAMRAQPGAASGFAAKAMKPKAQAPAKDLVITSPNAQISWTIHTNHVQYTENGQPAPVQDFLPTNSPIAAGSSPGGNVCWLVGADGAVVRTTDGRLWLGTNSPTGSDLSAIKATSAKAATVTSADGHTYLTVDGGQTWKTQN